MRTSLSSWWLIFSFLCSPLAFAQTEAERTKLYSVRIAGSVTESPAKVTLTWEVDADATGYFVARKLYGATSWGAETALPGTTGQYQDSTVQLGVEYEYRIKKTTSADYTAYGFISMGIKTPLVETRGRVILVIDNTMSAALTNELAALQLDLVGDGWTVLRHDVARTDSVVAVKALIAADYQAAPGVNTAVFLLGHVPVPYSGDYAPDDHPEHVGAEPADVYYADMTGTWTDTTVNDVAAEDPRNRNAPGDGKFDQSTLPGEARLQVGRVDLGSYDEFTLSETELLRRYLNRDHQFRHRIFTAVAKGTIFDQFGRFQGEAFAADAWGNFSALVGPANVVPSATGDDNWFSNLSAPPRLLAYATGDGGVTRVGNIATTFEFTTKVNQAVFMGMFGSYLGDWDKRNNIMRATLGADGVGLAIGWAGRPYWYWHSMGQGHTIGSVVQLAQNNDTLYPSNTYARGVHVALMGDPTLRLHPVVPPANLTVKVNGRSAQLTWTASPDSPTGYHVYRAPTIAGPFVRLTSAPVAATSFVDTTAPSTALYQVRAVRLQTSNSGSYWNSSQGLFRALAPTVVAVATVVPAATPAGPQPARVRFTRSGTLNDALEVSYAVTGTAVSGVDYQPLPGSVTFAAGAPTTDLLIYPNGVPASAGKTLKVTIKPSAFYAGLGSAPVTILGQANAFALLRGTFQGEVSGSSFRHGTLVVVLGPAGTFTAAVRNGATRSVVTGTLALDGTFTGDLPGSGGETLHLALAVDGGPIVISGEVLDGTDVVGEFAAGRFPNGASPVAWRGTFNFGLFASAPEAGAGWGRFVVDATGTVRVVGQLADGTVFSAGTALASSGQALLSAALPQSGMLSGEIAFDPTAVDSDATASLEWSGPARAGTPLASGGYATLDMSASKYTPPAADQRLLPMANAAGNGAWQASGGGLASPLNSLFSLDDLNRATPLAPNSQSLAITAIAPATGLIRGQFRPSGTAETIAFTTIAVPKLGEAVGFFLRSAGSGRVTLGQNAAFPTPENQAAVSARPRLAITAPSAGAKFAHGTASITVTGAAVAVGGVASVQVQVQRASGASDFQTATGVSSWAATVLLNAGESGTVIVWVKAIGSNGRESLLGGRAFTVLP